jgi:2-polyprenyl-3-methyl-5-hydroxy-6-metoxy-1,4-benzoquinol methylase
MTTTTIDEARLEERVFATVGELSGAVSGVLALIGDRLGLYKAMSGAGPLTPAGLAEKAAIGERYAREWLHNQAAGGIVAYDPAAETFELTPESAMIYADESSPVYLGGGFDLLESMWNDVPKFLAAFQSGDGIAWGDHHESLFCGTEKFFRTGYEAHLATEWIPALEDVVAKLERGGKVADLGCGHGVSSCVIAEAFPNATVVGSDYHEPSIDEARTEAEKRGIGDRLTFEVARAQEFSGDGYDLVCTCDCLHDMGDPVGAASHIREALSPDGTWLLVEPFAHDKLEDNLNPVGRIFYGASTLVCCPNALSQEGGHSLGAQAGEGRLRAIAEEAGFTRFRRAAETPFNLILEARP